MKNLAIAHGMKGQGEKGFTLVELIAVVAIIALIAVYITIEISQSSDDAKVGLATAFLTSSVPGAISSYKSRNIGSCRDIDAEDARTGENLPDLDDGDSESSSMKSRLVARGLSPTTVWDDYWGVVYDRDEREITLEYPIFGTNAETIGSDLEMNLSENPQVVSAAYEDGTLTVVYGCS